MSFKFFHIILQKCFFGYSSFLQCYLTYVHREEVVVTRSLLLCIPWCSGSGRSGGILLHTRTRTPFCTGSCRVQSTGRCSAVQQRVPPLDHRSPLNTKKQTSNLQGIIKTRLLGAQLKCFNKKQQHGRYIHAVFLLFCLPLQVGALAFHVPSSVH